MGGSATQTGVGNVGFLASTIRAGTALASKSSCRTASPRRPAYHGLLSYRSTKMLLCILAQVLQF